MTISKPDIEEHVKAASIGINEMLSQHPDYDQTRGNRCDLLTLAVMNRILQAKGVLLRRELHQDEDGNWHYILAHEPIDAKPTDADLMSDLNPWQWGGDGQGILHMQRDKLTAHLTDRGAPASFVALRSVATVARAHDTRSNPFDRAA